VTSPAADQAADRLNPRICAGEIFSLLGPNGAGKTTTTGMLTTRVVPTSGQAFIGDADVVAHPALSKQLTGIASQRNALDRLLAEYEQIAVVTDQSFVARAGVVTGFPDTDGAGELVIRGGSSSRTARSRARCGALGIAAPHAARTTAPGPESRAKTPQEVDPMPEVIWKAAPEEHDYPAAANYLTLLATPAEVENLVALLRAAPTQHWKAKDLLRASGLALLPVDNPHVALDLQKIAARKALAPVLLVCGHLSDLRPLQVADGYHRICASYHADENTDIPCRLARPDISGTGRTAGS